MKRLFIAISIIFASIIAYAHYAYPISSESQEVRSEFPSPAKEALDSAEAYGELMEDVSNKNDGKVKGSCNSIATSSICRDYTGSYWTFDRIKQNCRGGGAASRNACPDTEIGGCKSGEGTILETVAWMYEEGGDPITREDQPYMMGVCNMTQDSKWVMPPEPAE
jgi:hypothetical protein